MHPPGWLKNWTVLLFVATLIQLVVPVDAVSQGDGGKNAILEKPDRISVAYCADCVPFHFKDEQGKPAGMLIDFWRLWSQKTGIKVDFRVAPWDDSLALVGAGVADAHAGLFFSKERDKFLDYGAALRKSDTHVFLHKSLPPISRLEELSAYRIGVLAEDYVEGYLKKRLPKAVIVPYPDYASIMMALKDGTLRGFAADTPTGIYHLQRSGLVESFSFSKDLLLYQNDWYAAAQEGNAALIKIINMGMALISQSEKTKIGRRWTGITKEKKTDALLISMDRAYSPMTFLNAQGQPAGFLVDLWRLWSEKTGRQIRFRENNWAESVEAVRKGEADVHAGLFKNDERDKWLNFAPEVYRIGTGLYHRVGEKVPDEPAQFEGQRLGVITGSHQETMAQTRWSNLQLIKFATAQELIHALLKGKVLAILEEVPIMDVLLDQMGMRGEIVLKLDQLFVEAVHPAVLKERKEVMTFVEQGFSQITQKELEELEKRWIIDPNKRVYFKPTEAVKVQERELVSWRVIVAVVFVTLALLFSILILNRYLKTARAKGLSQDILQSSKIRGIGVSVVGLFLAMTIVLAWAAINHIDQRIRQDMETTLAIVLKTTQGSLHLWVEGNKQNLSQLLIEPQLLKVTENLLTLPRDKDVLVKSSAQESARKIFNTHLEASHLKAFYIISPDFVNIASDNDNNIDSINPIAEKNQDLLKRVFRGEMVFVPPIHSDILLGGESGGSRSVPTLFFVGPLRNELGEIIAAVSLPMDPARGLSRLARGGRLGATFETYIFNKQGYFLTQSRFKGQVEKLGLISAGQQEILSARVSDPGGNLLAGFKGDGPISSRPLTLMAENATKGQAGSNIEGYRDYRGVPVLGAWLWDDVLGVGLASELDREEALDSFYSVRNTIILVLGVIVIFSLILTALSAWIGEQANLTLKRARDDLEQRVEERTQELQQSEEKTLSIIENALDGIISIDESGIIQSSNPAAEKIFGYQASELIGKNISILMPEPYKSEHNGYLKKYLSTGVTKVLGFTRELEGLRMDGAIFPMDISVSEMYQGEQRFFNGMVRDITKRKEAENKINQAREIAESANQAKSIFISSMSHEIRTPMNAILGYSQILERDKELNDKQKNGVESIHRAGKHLLGIINDILDFSKIEAGNLELHPHDFDLGSLVEDLQVIFSEKCREKKLELRSEGVQEGQKIHVHAEATKLRQVLVNLIGNAVKFTESGSVSLRVMPLAGDQFYFEVKDTGQGIPPDKLKGIFDSFQQDEEGVKKGGAGLGLAISKKIVAAMGGELEVESESGKGSRFFFSINLPPAKEDVEEKDDRLTKVIGLVPGQSVKAVLMDDNRDNLNVLAETLKEVGVQTIEAESGIEGLKKIREAGPDIIFVDYQMPGMNGLEVTKIVQGEYGKEKIKIVMISASTFDHHREMYLKEGVHGFVGKPFIRAEILGVLARLLNVQFEYEEELLSAGVPAAKEIDFSATQLPPELHKSIKELVSMGLLADLEESLSQVESCGPGGPSLAAHLKKLVEQFDADGIVKVLEQVSSE